MARKFASTEEASTFEDAPMVVETARPDPLDSLTSHSEAVISGISGKKRGPKPGSKRISNKALAEQSAAKIAEQLDALFTPKIFRSVLSAPAHMMLAVTGSKTWLLAEAEMDSLGETGAMAARIWLDLDPKYAALAIFGLSLLSVYGAHYAAYAQEKRLAKKDS